MNKIPRQTVHYTQLPEPRPDGVHYHELKTYRRELPGWLAEGREGKFVLIKGEKVHGFFDSFNEAADLGERLFLMQPFLVHEIREMEPIYRIRTW